MKRQAAATIGIAAAALALFAGVATVEPESARPAVAQGAVTVVLDQMLERPTDLAFNPKDGWLWIVNDTDDEHDTTVAVRDVGADAQRALRFPDSGTHYLANPTGIAVANTGEEHATSAIAGGGPTLWTSDLNRFRGGIESHLDMVHWTEPALGIATGADTARREYWVVNGSFGSVDRYLFNKPHVLGGNDHTDGRVYRYVQRSLRSSPGLPSHVEFDPATRVLYIADTGKGRVARLATRALRLKGRRLQYRRLPERLFAAKGGKVTTLAAGLARPVGIALKDGRLYVGEYATGQIVVLALDGKRVGTIDTGVGPNALTGLAAGPDGAIYALDWRQNRLLRVPL